MFGFLVSVLRLDAVGGFGEVQYSNGDVWAFAVADLESLRWLNEVESDDDEDYGGDRGELDGGREHAECFHERFEVVEHVQYLYELFEYELVGSPMISQRLGFFSITGEDFHGIPVQR